MTRPLDILFTALCDPENQPHQWSTSPRRLAKAFVRALPALEKSDIGYARDSGEYGAFDFETPEDAYSQGLNDGQMEIVQMFNDAFTRPPSGEGS